MKAHSIYIPQKDPSLLSSIGWGPWLKTKAESYIAFWAYVSCTITATSVHNIMVFRYTDGALCYAPNTEMYRRVCLPIVSQQHKRQQALGGSRHSTNHLPYFPSHIPSIYRMCLTILNINSSSTWMGGQSVSWLSLTEGHDSSPYDD